jgi:cytoskeletal protein CcmA (bactofilin family)
MNFQFAAESNANQVEMANNSTVKGSVYSNGPIYMGSKALITGNATSSGSTPTTSLIAKSNGSNPSVTGTAKAFTITNVSTGSQTTGSYPPVQAMPISDADLASTIDGWEAAAATGYNSPGSVIINGTNNQLGPAKINGDLTINGDLQINGTIWVDGNIIINGGAHVYLNTSYGNNGGVMIADHKADRAAKGKITVGNSAYISGIQKLNPKTPSYTMLFSTYTNTAANWNSSFAIELANPGVQGGVYYAPFGSFHMKNNGQIRAVAANGLIVDQNITLDYDGNWGNSGISNGPAGKWTITEWQIMY